jgi:hypothetical protein
VFDVAADAFVLLAHLLRSELIFGIEQHRGGGMDHGKRRAQIVRDDGQYVLARTHRVFELQALPVQLEKDCRLLPQDLGIDRLEQDVDRARFIAAEHRQRFVRAGRGDEDDRDVFRAFGAAHELGELETVHRGHVDIE